MHALWLLYSSNAHWSRSAASLGSPWYSQRRALLRYLLARRSRRKPPQNTPQRDTILLGSDSIRRGADLRLTRISQCQHVALKLYVQLEFLGSELDTELDVYRRIEDSSEHHPGRNALRSLFDSFELQTPSGRHRCLVHNPSGRACSISGIAIPREHCRHQSWPSRSSAYFFALDLLHQ